jgi:hypothetical protein
MMHKDATQPSDSIRFAAYLESRLISEGRMIVVFEDAPFESTEARIDRCLAEVGRSPLDFIVVLRDFGDRDEIGPRQPRWDPPWRVDQLHERSPIIQPTQRPPEARRKGSLCSPAPETA